MLGGREIWSATSEEGTAISVVTFPAPPSADERQALASLTDRLLARAGTPGVVAVLESKPTRAYLVLEPLVGVVSDLPALGLELARKLEILLGACASLSALHAAGAYHGFVSPELLGLDPKLAPRLLDLGREARSLDASLYCAPEVLEGDLPDARSDVYSLGRLLAFLLMGADPPLESQKIPRLDYLSKAPAGLARIVRRATCAEPLLRYASVESFANDIARYGEHEDVGLKLPSAREENFTGLSTPPASSPMAPPVSRPAERTDPEGGRRALLWAPASMLVAVLALSTLALNPIQASERFLARRALERSVPAERGPALKRLLGLGDRDFVGVSLDGASLEDAASSFADFASASLQAANLDRADLAGASLESANLSSASALGADLSGAKVERAVGLESVRCNAETLPPEGWICREGLLAKGEEGVEP